MVKLKERIGKKILKRKKKGFSREVRVHNFETAQSAVVLFDASVTESFQVIKEFRKFLESKGIKCKVYGYVPQKEVPQEMLFWKNYSFITGSHLNWYLKPSGEAVDAFYNEEPDILVDFTREIKLELQFLVQLSAARFKTGCFTETENDYDLMLSLTEEHDIRFMAEQFKIYIGMLNPVND